MTPPRSRPTCDATRSRARCSSPPTATAPWRRSSAASRVRRDVIDFALSAQGMGAEALQAAFSGALRAMTDARPARGSRASSCAATGCRSPATCSCASTTSTARRRGSPRSPADVLTAAPWDKKPDSGVNIAFSYAGLRALQLPDASLAGFPEEFRQGMAARASLLGDDGDSAPANWEGGSATPAVHVLVMISAEHEAALNAHDARVRAALERKRRAHRRRTRTSARRCPAGSSTSATPTASRSRRSRAAAIAPTARTGSAVCQRRVAADPRRRVHPRLPRRGGQCCRRRRRPWS